MAGVGLIVALLTLQSPTALPEPALPTAFDTGTALDLSREVEDVSRLRPAGGPADERAADLIRRRLLAIPGARRGAQDERVREQEFSARDADGRLVRMRNVFLALPATESGVRGGILVVAPRDTPVGVAGGASSSGIMLQLARFSATTVRRRPVIFVSTDGASIGNSGMRWFLSRFSDFAIEAAIVLDGPGEGGGDALHVWIHGGTTAVALDLVPTVERAVRRAGGTPRVELGALRQVAVGALPQSFGDQAPLIDAGIPAFTLSNRPDSPLRDDFGPSSDRVALAGAAATELIGAFDAAESVRSPADGYWLNGRILRPQPLRAVALLLLLPALVLAVDGWARLRRRDAPGGVAGVLRRAAVLAAAALAAHVAILLGATAGAAAGVPPLPSAVELGPGAVLAIAFSLFAGVIAWAGLVRRSRRPARDELPAALAALAALALILWLVNPFAALLAAPAFHAGALAARRWPPPALVALAGLAATGPLLLLAGLAARLDTNLLFAAWYAAQTSVSGARGVLVPALALAVVACLWSLGRVAMDRVVPAAPRRSGRRRGA